MKNIYIVLAVICVIVMIIVFGGDKPLSTDNIAAKLALEEYEANRKRLNGPGYET